MNSFSKYSKFIILIAFLLLALISMTGVVIIRLYGDEIKTYAINSLNKQLAVSVEIESIDISVFKNFPHLSIVFENVVASSSKDFDKDQFPGVPSDTLFNADRIFLRFNMIDILFGNYKIKGLIAEEGGLTMLTDRYGKVNYKLFKERESKGESELSVEMEMLKLKNFNFIFINTHKDIVTSGRLDEIILKGKLGNNRFDMSLVGSLFIETLKHEGFVWADKTKIESRIGIFAADSVYTITKGSISLNDLKLEAKGKITGGMELQTDLIVEGDNLGIKSIVNILPGKIKSSLAGYNPDGRANVRVYVNGALSSIAIPAIKAEYGISRGRIMLAGKPDITGISFSGSFSNGLLRNPGSSSFQFSTISANINKSALRGNMYIENLLAPYIKADLQGEFHSPDLNLFFAKPSLEITRGTIYPDLKIAARLSSFEDFDIQKIISTSLSGVLSVKNTGIIFKRKYPEILSMDGDFEFEGDSWHTEMGINTANGDIQFKGKIDHLLKRFIHNTSSLWVQGQIYSSLSDLSFLLVPGETTTESEPYFLPEKLFMKLDLNLGRFVMSKFVATDVTATLNYKPGFLNVSSIQLHSMKGSMNGFGGLIQDAEGKLLLKTSFKLDKMDINDLFDTFHNFNQDFITAKNLGGRISGSVELSTTLKTDLLPDINTTWSEVAITIENGELKEFEPLKNLSRFIEVSELEYVKFQTLQNTFVIKDSRVYVPQMDINSSAFNISASGEHGFDNRFDYNIGVNLSEILAKKARHKKENNEFATLEKDGERINIFLHIFGTPDDFKIRYDRKEAVQQIRRDIITEKKELRTILNEELGLFKKQFTDSTLKENKDLPPRFILEWDEEDETNKDSTLQKKKKREPAKKTNEFEFDWN